MSRRRRWIWAVILLCGVAAILLVWWFQRGSVTEQVVFSDRCQVKLRALTLGTNHFYAAGNLFQRTLARKLPDKWKARFRVREMQVRLDPELRGLDVLAAWVEVVPATNTILVRVADNAGREQVAAHGQAAGGILTSGGWLTAHVFSSFPRREQFLTLRVYAQGRGYMEPVSEFRVRNPAYRRHPVWTPEGLPVTRETNGFQFTFMELSTGLFATGGLAQTFGSNWTAIKFEQDTGPWHVVDITLTDAAGNRVHKHDPMQRLVSDTSRPHVTDPTRYRTLVSVPAMLWLDEPAWKIRLELERRGRSGFQTNEFWNVLDVPVPGAGKTNLVNLSPQGHGRDLMVESISTHGGPRKVVQITVKHALHSDSRLSLLNATDTRGTNIHFITEPTRDNKTAFRLAAVPPEAEQLNLRFAVHKVIAVELMTRPHLLHTNMVKVEP